MILCSAMLAVFAVGLSRAQQAAVAPPDPAQELVRLQRLAASGRGDEALRGLDAISAQHAGAVGLDRVRGLALYDLNRLSEAEKSFAAAQAVDPRDAEAREMRGLTLFRLGRPADAIPLLEASVTASSAAAHPGLTVRGAEGSKTAPSSGATIVPGGSQPAAVQPGAVEPGMGQAAAQTKADPHYVLALCYVDVRRYDDARRAYAAQYGFAPESAAAYGLAARMLLRREYLPVAQRFATQAVALDARLPLAHEVLGEIALAQNQMDTAAKEFALEQAADPLAPAPYERLGDLLGRQGRFDEARQQLQRAVLLEPNSTGPYILLGKTTLKQGDAVAALTYLQRAAQMDEGNYMTHNLLAQTYRTLGRGAEADRELALTRKLQEATAPKLSSPGEGAVAPAQ